jgi:branched-chain amino acid transport system substrate-binding protein
MNGYTHRLLAWVTVFTILGLFSVMGTVNAQEVLKVGAVQAVRGAFAECFRQIDDGLRDSLAIANQEGGIDGRTIEYIMKPTAYDVDESEAAFNAIYNEHRPGFMVGNSTGLSLRLADDIAKKYKVIYTSSSYSAELAYAARYPSIFLPGPTYGEQVALLLQYIAREAPNSSVAFFYSDTAFGKDPIKFGKIMCRRLRLKVAGEVMVKLGIEDVSQECRQLQDMKPDFVIFQGFVLEPVPMVIEQCRNLGMTCQFMGTFWTATKAVLDRLGPLASGYLVVNPFAYWGDTKAPMIQKIMEYNALHHPDITYRPNYYMHGFAQGLIFTEILRKASKAGKMNFEGLVEALQSIENFDTGGLTAPLTNRNNRFPVARVWKANPVTGRFEAASDWLVLRD